MVSHKIKTMKCEQFGPEYKFFGYKEEKGHQIHKHTSQRKYSLRLQKWQTISNTQFWSGVKFKKG